MKPAREEGEREEGERERKEEGERERKDEGERERKEEGERERKEEGEREGVDGGLTPTTVEPQIKDPLREGRPLYKGHLLRLHANTLVYYFTSEVGTTSLQGTKL